MEQKNVIFGSNADEEFFNLIRSNNGFFKCLIVATKQNINNNIGFVNSVISNYGSYKFIELPDNALNNELVIRLIKKELTDDVGLIVVIENLWVLNEINKFYNNTAFVCVSPSISEINASAKFVIYNFNRATDCSLHAFCSCVGECLSMFSFVIEQVFNACVYEQNVGAQNLIKLEKLLFNFATIPQSVLNSKFGKLYFCKLVHTIASLIDNNYLNCNVYNLANNLIYNSEQKFNYGYALGYSSKILFNAFNYVFNIDYISSLTGFNAENRVEQFRAIKVNNNQLINNNLYNFNYESTALLNNFNGVKNDFSIVLLKYKRMFLKAFNKFLNLQFDKGYSQLKYLKPNLIKQAFNKLPEQSSNANFVTFLREFGFLNEF